MLKHKGPLVLALIWSVFTTFLVGWWWFYGLDNATTEKSYRMLLWEGGFLLLIVLLGAGALVFYTRTHQLRHERLKLFFANFAHDLKTSITRLRLQAEVLEENHQNPIQLQELLENIQRLDLQLENSLWMASLEDRLILSEEFKLSELLRSLRPDFVDLKIELRKDAFIQADRRAMQVALRNILQNSRIHGEADSVVIETQEKSKHLLQIEVSDNGKGLSSQGEYLGEEPLSLKGSKQTNGIGLYLTKKLLQKMKGDYGFQLHPQFKNIIQIQGKTFEKKL